MTLEEFYETFEEWGEKREDHKFYRSKLMYSYEIRGLMVANVFLREGLSHDQSMQFLIEEAVKLQMKVWQISLQNSLVC